MALFGSQDAARIQQLFASEELTELVWREDLANVANGADFVDVVLSSTESALKLQKVYKVGLAYWPNGPVVRGVQNYTQGTSVTFARVPVKPGAQLALAASTYWGDSLPARVDVVPAGGGASVEDQRRGQQGSNPLDSLFKGTGVVLGAVVVLALVYVFAKVEG